MSNLVLTADDSGRTFEGRQINVLTIRSLHFVEGGVHRWEPPQDINIFDSTIRSVHIYGAGKTAEGTIYEDGSNPYKDSSYTAGHTAWARKNAPSSILLEDVTITAGWVYLAPGVHHVGLRKSRLVGRRDRGAIYMDAESAFNVIERNEINITTNASRLARFTHWMRWPPGLQAISIDASSNNTIRRNEITCDYDAVHFYRNCGEKGCVRHTPPERNTLVHNTFRGRHPRVIVGSRDSMGWYPPFNFFPCACDRSGQFGSAISDGDEARYNVITDNDFDQPGMITSRNWEDNHSNIIERN